jgi:T-complex protein 1 subunit theta
MAMHVPKAGFSQMMKEGAKVDFITAIELFWCSYVDNWLLQHYAGLEEAVYRNINACQEMATVTRTSFGPNGLIVVLYFLSFTLITDNLLFLIEISSHVF